MTTFYGTNAGDQLAGTSGNDVIYGYDGADILYGDSGNDTLYGGNGSDFLEGGSGNDWLDGGADFDFATYIVATSAVNVNLSIATAQNTGGAGTDTLVGIEGLMGSGYNDTLTGDAYTNLIDGGAGRDTMIGGGGDDILQVSVQSDFVAGESYDGGSGYDALNINAQVDLSSCTVTGLEQLYTHGYAIGVTAAQLDAFDDIRTGTITITTSGSVNLGDCSVLSVHTIYLTAAGGVSLNFGNGGIDFYVGGSAGGDTVRGGYGNETFYGNGGNDSLYGNGGNDLLYGNAGDDLLDGGDGNDILTDDNGNNTLNGGAGNDTFFGATGNDVIDGGSGIDTLTFASFSTGVTVDLSASGVQNTGGAGNDSFSGIEILIGSSVNDVLTGDSGNNTIEGGTGRDTVRGGAGDDVFVSNGFSAYVGGETYDGGDGYDKLLLSGSVDLSTSSVSAIEEISAGEWICITTDQLASVRKLTASWINIKGPGTADLSATELTTTRIDLTGGVTLNLAGRNANFSVTGSASNDDVNGGLGDDFIFGMGGTDTLHGNAGNDIIYLSGSGAAYGGAGNDKITSGDDLYHQSGTLRGPNQLYGDSGDDEITISNLTTYVDGGDGDDIITLPYPLSLPNATIFGGAGVDRLSFHSSVDADLSGLTLNHDIEEIVGAHSITSSAENLQGVTLLQTGTLTITTAGTLAFTAATLTAQTVYLNAGGINFSIAGSTTGITICGDGGAQTITGGSGNDRLFGNGGADIVSGGGGDDYISAVRAGAGAQYSGGTGYDILSITENDDMSGATVASDFEELALFGGGIMRADQLAAISNVSCRYVSSGWSSVHLTTGGTINLSATQVTRDYYGLQYFNIFLAAGGNNVTLPGNSEVILGVYGNTGADTIHGSSGEDHIYTRDGNDVIYGGGGNDWLGGEGGHDEVYGGDGNDYISGSDGDDTLDGGNGDDTFYVSSAAAMGTATQVIGGAGIDRISIDWSVGATNLSPMQISSVEKLDTSTSSVTLSLAQLTGFTTSIIARTLVLSEGGSADISGADVQVREFDLNAAGNTLVLPTGGTAFATTVVGGAGSDTVRGGTGNNTISGNGGDDVIGGGIGNDKLEGGSGSDTLSYGAASGGVSLSLAVTTAQTVGGGQGTDTVTNFENLTGSGFADTLTGNAGANTILGGNGDDAIAGLAGDDALDGGDGSDTADFGADTAGITADLAAGTATGSATGSDSLANFENLRGGSGVDTLIGNAGANLLSGGNEHDTLTGGAGNDTLDGGSNIDTAVFAGASTAYTITQISTGVFQVVGPDGTDTLTDIEYAQFSDTATRLLPGSGTTIDWSADPSTYMTGIRDFDGNDLGSTAGWKLIGTADVNGDGTVEHILVNRAIGRWAEVSTEADGKSYFANNGWAGDTRVVGTYIDPLVASGEVVAGSDFDSQRRFQNDLNIENIHGILGQNDYNHDGLQEIYFSLTDGTAYLHAYMHADGNIQYANYQNEQQVKDYLTANGFTATAWAGWFPAAQSPLAAVAG